MTVESNPTLRSVLDRASELKIKGLTKSSLLLNEVMIPMLSALGWQKKNGRPISQLAGYFKVEQKPEGVLGLIGETPQFLFGPVDDSLPYAGTQKATELLSYSYNMDAPWLVLSDLNMVTVFNVLENVKISPRLRSPRFTKKFEDIKADTKELENWLGFESVKEGNLAELDQQIRRAKGIALPVTDKLFDQMRRWRLELIKEITSISSLTPNEADILVNRLLNRLLFIRVCEDRGFGEQPSLETIIDDPSSIQQSFGILQQVRNSFKKYDERYDTELFKSGDVDDFPFPEEIVIQIIRGLHTPGFPSVKYDFSVIDADILGAMYEQYVRLRASWQAPAKISSDAVQQTFLSLPRTTLVSGGKVTGIYYTPKYIVEHIARQTVGQWMDDHPVSLDDPPSVLDMSCGSGSFLLATYQQIVNHYSASSSLSTEQKHALLTKSIFGIDRDPRAAEIARLNLWLIGLNSRVSLPDLSQNIKIGNSLLDPLIQEDSTALQLFFGADWEQRKPIIWKSAFPNQILAGGFDIIVGNPPYVRIQNMEDQLEKNFYGNYFGDAAGSFDLSVAFVEMALKLLKPGGVIGLIVSNSLLKSNYAELLRKRLINEGVLRHVVDFTDQRVFQGVGVYTCLLFLQKPGSTLPKVTSIFKLKSIPALQLRWSEEEEVYNKQMISGKVNLKALNAGPWVLVPDREQKLRTKIIEGRQRLWQFARIFQGVKTGRDKAYILKLNRINPDEKLIMAYSEITAKEHPFELDLMKPLIKGGNMRRFQITESGLMILMPYHGAELIGEESFRINYPNTWHYLEQVKGDLLSRSVKNDKGWGSNWYAFSRPQNLSLIAKPKIITPDIAAQASFAYDEEGRYYFSGGAAGGYGLTITSPGVSPLFLLGLLNSSLLDWFFEPGAARFQEGYFIYEDRFLRNQPIESFNDKQGRPKGIALEIVKTVEDITNSKKKLRTSSDSIMLAKLADHVQDLERSLDDLVFKLYQVSSDEIKLIQDGPWYKKF